MAKVAIWISTPSTNYRQRIAMFRAELEKHKEIDFQEINDTNNLEFDPDNYDLVFAHESDIRNGDIEYKLKHTARAKVVIFTGFTAETCLTETYLITQYSAVTQNLAAFLQHYRETGVFELQLLAKPDGVINLIEQADHTRLSAEQFNEIITYLNSLKIGKILFADDDIPPDRLKRHYQHLLLADNIPRALDIITQTPDLALAIIDINFANTRQTGFDISKAMKSGKKIMLTGYDGFAECLQAWQNKADYFVSKHKFNPEHLRSIIELIDLPNMPIIISKNKQMQDNWQKIKLYAGLKQDILITGENGTGKELAARAIYELGRKKLKGFVAQNCAGIPETLFEGIMFGYVKGAYTGAYCDKPGLFEAADKGVLFLDEIGDMPLFQQAKLLRALQEKHCSRLGSAVIYSFDTKLIFATNKGLHSMMDEGLFRMDLYYRMIGAELRIPPLRERAEDIEMLSAFFVHKFITSNMLSRQFSISATQLEILKQYSFPGNIRELEKIISQACINALLSGQSDLIVQIPSGGNNTPATLQTNPVFFGFEQLINLLHNKIINSKGLSAQVKVDLIAYLSNQGTDTSAIANLLGITEQSIRNIKSLGKKTLP
ncbi:MAG: sigma 54-interacting transcriptional regulator [Candidatus Cloacimonas sp.]|jgi:DNA-binding NtrC family response regulator|nr:sigma 54-interacting transcriptional regulator [Candidatus Cloacimonas sp.]